MIKEGLSDEEVNERIRQFGYNELRSDARKGLFRIALELVREPMILLLLSCAGLYAILGDYMEGSVLMSTTILIIFIEFYQSQKTERSLEELKRLSSPRALVLRNGEKVRIAGRDVVPDDIIYLYEGDRVSGDATLLSTDNLSVDESMLTGESFPVLKDHENEDLNKVYSGTLVVGGHATAKVYATGMRTEFGKLGLTLSQIERNKTRLQSELKTLIRNLFIIGGTLSVGVTLLYYFSRENFIDSLLVGLSTAMAILPEEFPVALTIFLALGAWRLSKQSVLTRNPATIETLGSATVLCSDKTGTITKNKMAVAAISSGSGYFNLKETDSNPDLDRIIHAASNACPIESIDPMDAALRAVVKSDSATLVPELNFPISKSLFAYTNIFRDEGELIAYTKGAPEAIFRLCHIGEEAQQTWIKQIHEMAQKGWRILAIAEGSVTNGKIPKGPEGIEFKFLGLIAFEDPIRDEVPAAIQECQDAGIKVIMITGDFPETARTIARQIGLNADPVVVTGSDLNAFSEEELTNRIANIDVFARVIPEQKLRIVEALKANGETVAMTGDGVNDAPALKAADIGIAMGRKGTDVAREAASLVLMDDNFASIVAAIRSGRRIYDNLGKAMTYILAVHIPIVGLTLLPAFNTSLPILLMPLHIVFMELIIDPASSVVFESEQEERDIMKRKPRDPKKTFFGRKEILLSILEGTLLLLMTIAVYFYNFHEGHTEEETRAIMFSSVIIGNIALILSGLSQSKSILSTILEFNRSFILISSVALIVLVCTLTIPILRELFAFEMPGYKHFIPSVIGVVAYLFILELIKLWLRKVKAKKA